MSKHREGCDECACAPGEGERFAQYKRLHGSKPRDGFKEIAVKGSRGFRSKAAIKATEFDHLEIQKERGKELNSFAHPAGIAPWEAHDIHEPEFMHPKAYGWLFVNASKEILHTLSAIEHDPMEEVGSTCGVPGS